MAVAQAAKSSQQAAELASAAAARTLASASGINASGAQAKELATAMANAAAAGRAAAAEVAKSALAWADAPVGQQRRAAVAKLYLALLGRAPDQDGFNSGTASLKAGYALADLANWMLAAQETQKIYPPGMGSEAFITTLFNNLQGMAPDAATLKKWQDKAATLNRGQLVAGIVEEASGLSGVKLDQVQALANLQSKVAESLKQASATLAAALTPEKVLDATAKAIQEASDKATKEAEQADAAAAALAAATPYAKYARPLTELYLAVLGRGPSADEFYGDMGKLRAGGTLVDIADRLLGTEQGVARFPSEAKTFVHSVYLKVLGREPDDGGAKTWLQDMVQGGKSRAQTLVGMLDGVKNYSGPNAVWLGAQHRFQNRVSAALAALAEDASKGLPAARAAMELAERAAKAAEFVGAGRYSDPASTVLTPALKGKVADGMVEATPVTYQESDRWGNVISVSDARNRNWKTEYSYNAANQLVSTTMAEAEDRNTGNKVRAVARNA
ncbi:DUF4214 domain-containing protein, partial [Massilia sp. YIM B04103]|uniref:DUF4214 domain-containing protein n=1 Tax=Massilia sp. YIM B04103 TaxID=2963106 RepID=UPI00210C5B59